MTGLGLGLFSVIWVREALETVAPMAGMWTIYSSLLIGIAVLSIVAATQQWESNRVFLSVIATFIGGVFGFFVSLSGPPLYYYGYIVAVALIVLAVIIQQWEPGRLRRSLAIAVAGAVLGTVCLLVTSHRYLLS